MVEPSTESSEPRDLVSEDSSEQLEGVLQQLSKAFDIIGVASHPESMAQIWSVSPPHARTLVLILERLPKATLLPIIECLQAYCSVHREDGVALCRELIHLGTDPRSYREASSILDGLFASFSKDRASFDEVESCLRLLNEHGALGLLTISRISRFLRALDRRPGTLVLRPGGILHAGDERIELQMLMEFERQIQAHSKLWGPRAVAIAIDPKAQSFGALDRVEVPVRGTLVVDEPALVMLPGPAMQMELIRVDPIPVGLTTPQASSELYPYLTWMHSTSVDKNTLDVVYLGVRVIESIVQKKWFQTFRVAVRVHDQRSNRACYVPSRSELHLWRGPLSAWSVVHELAHALDDHLHDGPGFASDQPGHPLAAFAAVVRPDAFPVARARAEKIWTETIQKNFASEILVRAALSGQTVSLGEVLDAVSWPVPLWKQICRGLLVDGDLDSDEIDLAFGQGMGNDFHRMMSILESGLVGDRLHLDWSVARDWFMQQELDYLLSNREIFARFFDQYARLYWAQTGRPYGPSSRPGDLDPYCLAGHVPLFHQALVEAQISDIGHIQSFVKEDRLVDTAGSFVAAAVLVGIGSGIIPGP